MQRALKLRKINSNDPYEMEKCEWTADITNWNKMTKYGKKSPMCLGDLRPDLKLFWMIYTGINYWFWVNKSARYEEKLQKINGNDPDEMEKCE